MTPRGSKSLCLIQAVSLHASTTKTHQESQTHNNSRARSPRISDSSAVPFLYNTWSAKREPKRRRRRSALQQKQKNKPKKQKQTKTLAWLLWNVAIKCPKLSKAALRTHRDCFGVIAIVMVIINLKKNKSLHLQLAFGRLAPIDYCDHSQLLQRKVQQGFRRKLSARPISRRPKVLWNEAARIGNKENAVREILLLCQSINVREPTSFVVVISCPTVAESGPMLAATT